MIAPDTTTAQNQITNTFNANATITSWVHGLENCVLPVLTPQPSWFSDLNSALQTAQKNALSWLQQTSPQLFAQATQSFIDYANAFKVTIGPGTTATVSSVVAEIQTAGGIPTADQQKLLTTLVSSLLQTATAQQAIAVNLQEQMDAFRTQMGQDNLIINDGIASATKQAGQDSAQIQSIQNSIQELMLQLTADNTKVSNADVSYGSAIFSTIIGLTFGLAAASGVLGIGVVIGAVISIGSAITSEIVYTEDVKKDIANICNLLSQLPEEQQQLALTQSIISTLDTLSESNDAALQTFVDLTAIWATVVDDLQWLLVVLDQPRIDVNKIPALTSLTAANNAWQQISAFATQTQNLSLQQPPLVNLPTAIIAPNVISLSAQQKAKPKLAKATPETA